MLTHKKIQAGLLALALMQIAPAALAARQACYGTVRYLHIESDGDVMVWTSWRNDFIRVCNINYRIGNLTPQICNSWFSMLQSAVTNNEDMGMLYTDIPACNTIPTYDSAPIPFYVMLVN